MVKIYLVNKFSIISKIIVHVIQIVIVYLIYLYKPNLFIIIFFLGFVPFVAIINILYMYFCKVKELTISDKSILVIEKKNVKKYYKSKINKIEIKYGKRIFIYKRAYLKIYLKNNTVAIHDISNISYSDEIEKEIENCIWFFYRNKIFIIHHR